MTTRVPEKETVVTQTGCSLTVRARCCEGERRTGDVHGPLVNRWRLGARSASTGGCARLAMHSALQGRTISSRKCWEFLNNR